MVEILDGGDDDDDDEKIKDKLKIDDDGKNKQYREIGKQSRETERLKKSF